MVEDWCWLPDLLPCDDLAQWEAYEDHLYEIFERDFLLTKPTFEGLPVNTRRHPMEHGREEAFWHITCCDYGKDGERQPDMNRCERIRWARELRLQSPRMHGVRRNARMVDSLQGAQPGEDAP